MKNTKPCTDGLAASWPQCIIGTQIYGRRAGVEPLFCRHDFANAKPAGSRLGLAVQLKFFAAYGYFATAAAEAPDEAVSYLAEQTTSSAKLNFWRSPTGDWHEDRLNFAKMRLETMATS
nr:DUF4158 domain-containing protein [Mesorhizobium carmichaelinearum]